VRRHLVDVGLLDLNGSEPTERAVEIEAEFAVHTAPADEPFDAVGVAKGLRARWLRKRYQVMD
jgi:hypothetical protein